ncbi:MAG: hypothetical protein ACOX4R_06050 [Lentihominibacter sp.]
MGAYAVFWSLAGIGIIFTVILLYLGFTVKPTPRPDLEQEKEE